MGQKNAVTLSQLRQIIRNGGFSSGTAEIEAIGTLSMREGQAVLKVGGTNEEFRLKADARNEAAFAEARRYAETGSAASYLVIGTAETSGELKVRSVRRQ
jgi:hypothetical protein